MEKPRFLLDNGSVKMGMSFGELPVDNMLGEREFVSLGMLIDDVMVGLDRYKLRDPNARRPNRLRVSGLKAGDVRDGAGNLRDVILFEGNSPNEFTYLSFKGSVSHAPTGLAGPAMWFVAQVWGRNDLGAKDGEWIIASSSGAMHRFSEAFKWDEGNLTYIEGAQNTGLLSAADGTTIFVRRDKAREGMGLTIWIERSHQRQGLKFAPGDRRLWVDVRIKFLHPDNHMSWTAKPGRMWQEKSEPQLAEATNGGKDDGLKGGLDV